MDLQGKKYVAIDAECLRDVKPPFSFDRSEYLGNAVTCTYTNDGEFKDWIGNESIAQFMNYILQFDYIIGYNTISFDYPLWGGALLGAEHPNARKIFLNATKGKTIDLAKDVYDKFKQRIKLQNISVPTLGDAKEMDGGFAPEQWRNGACFEVIEYCRGDVRRTLDLFFLAATGEELKLKSYSGDIKTFKLEPKIR